MAAACSGGGDDPLHQVGADQGTIAIVDQDIVAPAMQQAIINRVLTGCPAGNHYKIIYVGPGALPAQFFLPAGRG